MRIAVVQPKVDRSGGAERYALALVTGLAARGHEVHVFARRAEGLPEGVRLHRIPSVPFGRALKTYSFWRLTARRIRPHHYDVVHGSGKTTCQTVHRAGGGVHRAYLERTAEAGRPTGYDRVVLGIEQRLFSSPHLRAVICPSRWVAREVERFHPEVVSKIEVIPNGVDTERFRPEGREGDRRSVGESLGIPPQDPLLLFVGTNFRLKGLEAALGALARLPGAHLVVVGGDDPDPFREHARSLGCLDRVHFVGARDDTPRWYRAADVLVHPTEYDPFANVCLEALASGTPVVTTPANGAADVLEGAPLAGAVVEAEPEGLTQAISGLLAAGRAAREAARALAEASSLDGHVSAVERVYRRTREGAS
ncbi:glycosyltransferase family 4 protein [Deferrisoma camini]|uniref:glycosyltransferase family 4 protein n=1 Tax=Deferrisoma camini TaxID=1035120 RepID=UPI00046D905B|nr:glycosyltransferase family 4 protein [Deferrisoma camini]